MKQNPIIMEDHFRPGFKTTPAVHNGSQTIPFFHGIAEEQAFEGYYLAAAGEGDIAVVRNFDRYYIKYWKNLIGNHHIINLTKTNPGDFLTQVILENSKIINKIKNRMDPKSKLHVFSPTRLEQKLAEKLGIPLHGTPEIGELYGTKSGIRSLAREYGILMSPGFTCKNIKDVENAVINLKDKFADIVIKYDHSLGGYFNKKIRLPKNKTQIKRLINEIADWTFNKGKNLIVVEGWLKEKATPCAHIEISEGSEPIICAAWQQIVDEDGVSRIGAGPLMLSDRAMESFLSSVNLLAKALKEKNATGSFGPDFLITSEDEKNFPPDTAVLIELNARIPMTAVALDVVRQVRGRVGSGFLALHLKLPTAYTFKEIARKLNAEGILIKNKDPKAKGVVPFNVGLLPWKIFDLVAMADTWEETLEIMRKAQKILHTTVS